MAIPAPFHTAWRNSGLRVITLQCYTHGQSKPLHTIRPAHSHWGLHLFIAGRSQLALPSGSVALGPGDAVLTRPDEGYTQDIEASQWMTADFELITLPGYEDPLRRLKAPAIIRGLDHQEIKRWREAIPSTDSPMRSMRLRPLLDGILTEVLCHGFAHGHLHLASGALPRWLADLRQELGQPTVLHDPRLDLRAITRLAGIGRSQLCRDFQLHLGCSPMQWVRRERITNACRLLRNGDGRSIARIATSCGYKSVPLFCRHFQQHLGCSASAWRKAATGCHRES
ncbi:MAG: AraC family transcriptional regulator [Planctomycetota bacterium]|nr:MAG: AraC family transcriptional regulator [Planctomycetota bacterium]